MRRILILLVAALMPLSAFSAASKENSRATNYKPLPFLTFDQLANLENGQRIAYIKNIREAALSIEKAQFMFRNSSRDSAYLDKLKNEESLFAILLFGNDAFADDPQCRGRSITDRCIYAFNVSSYPDTSTQAANCKDGKRQPFQCRFDQFKCTGQDGPGVRCNSFISGLGSHPGFDCVPDKQRMQATKICVAKQEALSKSNDQEIQNILAASKSFFGLNGVPEKRTGAEMVAPNAANLLKELSKHSYDPEVYAHLIYVVNIYKRNGIQMPFKDADRAKLEALLDPKKFDNNVRDFQGAINEIFGDYYRHCNATVDESEIQALINTTQQDLSNTGGAVQDREMKRRAAAELARSGGGGKKVKDITESEECTAIQGELDDLRDRLTTIANTCPSIEGKPCGPEIIGDAPPTTPDEQTPVVDDGIKPIGCGSARDDDPHELYQPAARCMPCLASRAMAKAGNTPDYSASTKWISLLSTMTIACGEGTEDGKKAHLSEMVKYMQTFGHCASDTYRWAANEMTPEKRKLIESWSGRNFWREKKWYSSVAPDKKDDFAKVYGISYKQAFKVFCKQTRDGFGSLLNEDSDLKIEVSPNTSVNSVADSLKQCMHESHKNATKLYGGSSGNSCSTVVSGNSLQFDSEPYKSMVEHVVGGPNDDKKTYVPGALVAYSGDTCYETIQIQKNKNTGREVFAFNDAPLPKNGQALTNRFNLRYMAMAPEEGRPRGVYQPTLTCFPSAKDTRTNSLCSGPITDYYVTAPDPKCGVVASKESPTGDGKKKTK